MRRLFDENDDWNDEAQEIARKISTAIRPIVSDAVSSGLSVRDLELIFSFEVGSACSEFKIRADRERRKRGT